MFLLFVDWILRLSLSATLASASPVSLQTLEFPATSTKTAANLPLILWHGLGDSFDSDGIRSVADIYRETYPNSQVYLVHVGDTGSADRHGTFFGNLTDQVRGVCEDLQATPEFANASAANGLGFSQGGQFLRALIQRCDIPHVKNLVTFGSQHNGITSFAACADDDWICKLWDSTLKGNTYSAFAQANLVPAQYYRDPADLDSYLEYSNFLADVNNERQVKNETYKRRIASLDRFVMYTFEEENVVKPPESSSFGQVNVTSGQVTPLRERQIYLDDWLGLKKLDEKGGLVFRTTPGKHMQIEEKTLREAFEVYMKPEEESVKACLSTPDGPQLPILNDADRNDYDGPKPSASDAYARPFYSTEDGYLARWSRFKQYLEGLLGLYTAQIDGSTG